MSDHPTQRSHLRSLTTIWPPPLRAFLITSVKLSSNTSALGYFLYHLIACPFCHPRVILYLQLSRAMSRELNCRHVFELGAIALVLIHLGGF